MTVTVSPAQTAVEELQQCLDWLIWNLLPGTHKPYIPPQMSAEKRAELDRANREWNTVTDIGTGVQIPLGESPAPMDLDIADLIAEISDTADDLSRLVSLAAKVEPLRPAVYAFSDPRPYLRHVIAFLPVAAGVHSTVEDRCDGLIFRAHTLLGLLGDGQLLNTVCPFCGGRTSHHPIGGAKTLRVRAVLPKDVKRETAAIKATWLIVCEGACEPKLSDVGEWHRGRPAWNIINEGAWLADQIEASGLTTTC